MGGALTDEEPVKVVGARVLPYSLPLTVPYRTASGERNVREGFLLTIRADDGTEGLGEAAPLPGRTEPLRACGSLLRRAAAELARGRPDGEAALAWLEGRLPELGAAGGRAARAAAASAIFDLRAREAGLSLATWLAGRRTPGMVPARWVPLNATLPATGPDAAARAAAEAVERGFRCLKLKVGLEAGKDLARARAVRGAAGPGVALRLDANGAWTPEEAPRRLRSFLPLKPEYVEQPLPAPAVREMASLRRKAADLGLRLAADESVTGLEAARRLLDLAAADVLVLKPTLLGGPDVALAIADEAAGAAVGVVFTSALDGIAGRLAALHAAASLGPGLPACGLATGRFLAREAAVGSERMRGGRMRVPEGPGLGAWLPAGGEAAFGSCAPAATPRTGEATD